MLPQLIAAFRRLPSFRTLAASLPGRGNLVELGGLPGSSGAVLVAAILDQHRQRTVVVVAPTPADAERWLADLTVLAGDRVRLYPQREGLAEDEPHFEIAGERVETIQSLLRGDIAALVTTARATAEKTALPGTIAGHRFDLATGDDIKPAAVTTRLEALGYERRPTVLDVAQFAVRGGIVDLYGFGMASPTRIEWWGDEIESIRGFDLDTQRSEAERSAVSVLPVKPASPPEPATDPVGRQSILELVPADTLLVVDRDADDRREVDRLWREAEHHLDVARRRGETAPGRDQLFLEPHRWAGLFDGFARISVSEAPPHGDDGMDLQIRPPEQVDRDVRKLRSILAAGPTLVLCDNEGQLERLEELMSESEYDAGRLPPNLTLAIGALQGGFSITGLAVLTDHEIFRRARRIRRPRRYRQAFTAGAAGALTAGDYVVHLEHGIGVYRGIETITTEGGTVEVAVLEYLGGDMLRVPLYRLDQLERYRSAADQAGEDPPKLDRIGGNRWKRQRAKTQSAIRAMAAELLDLYARRAVAVGYAFPPDTRWQAALESAFLYEDTADQRTAIEGVKRDMERPEPMDRLVVGDVGYGKTEIAVRAAFKSAVAGKQVAVLVPTTILAEQHGRTFAERMADFPVVVEVLSRFRTPAEQRDILERLADGKIDIIIGTHRLLSKDAKFHDLGLLIVDEEQRFGVRHKERLKTLRLTVDILTLTATPIPRTLHQALSGLRKMSLIQTPPRDRSPVLPLW